jgi:hypothetical protein
MMMIAVKKVEEDESQGAQHLDEDQLQEFEPSEQTQKQEKVHP